jgi:phosphatidylglycerophosphate synthase
MNQIGVVDEWVTILTLVGAAVSTVMSCVASRHGLVRLRPIHAGVAVLSAIYVVGYLWLLFGNPSVVLWSSVMRGFSLTAWVLVWIAPAWTSWSVNRELHQAIRLRHEQDEGDPR